MFKTYFDSLHVFELSAALSLLFISIICFNKKKYKVSIILLLFSGIVLRYFMITLDPFLNVWDEQLHVLVAKNMMHHPFKPMFYSDPVLPFDFRNYIGNSVWVHKQPLFLWQMALSMKIFGVNEIAARVPGLIMSALMILLIYRTGTLSMNRSIGYIGAMLFAFGNFSLELVSGWCHTDHNDSAFLFYVSASIWAFTEYYFNPRKRWIIFTGILTGCAVLVKWLPALIVFFIWFIAILCNKDKRKLVKSYYDFAIAFIISVIIFMPWTIYTHLAFPQEAAYESHFNTLHFITCLEGHYGNFFYHINKIDELYFPLAKFLFIPALFLFYRNMKMKSLALAITSGVVFIYLFFSIAKTKMPAFTTMVNMPVYLAFAALIYGLWHAVKFRNRIPNTLYILLISVILFIIAVFELNIERIQYIHTNWRPKQADYRKSKLADRKVYNAISKKYKNKGFVIFNVKHYEHPSCMFYTSLTAYDYLPDDTTITHLIKEGRTPVIIQRDSLPPYILENKHIEIVNGNE